MATNQRTEEQVRIDTNALRLRGLGFTYQKIADQTGCSKQTAYERVQRALAAIPAEVFEEMRQIEVERLDTLMEVVMEKALSGDKGFLFAVDRALAVAERRAKLLGLDQPTKTQVEVTTYEGGTDIDRELHRLTNLIASGASSGIEAALGSEQAD